MTLKTSNRNISALCDTNFKAHISFSFLFFFFFFSFSEHVKLLRPDGYEVFNQRGCNSSYPAGTSLEVPFGDAQYLILDISLEHRWSVANVKYSIVGRTLYSGSQPMAFQKLLTLQVILGISLKGNRTLSN